MKSTKTVEPVVLRRNINRNPKVEVVVTGIFGGKPVSQTFHLGRNRTLTGDQITRLNKITNPAVGGKPVNIIESTLLTES